MIIQRIVLRGIEDTVEPVDEDRGVCWTLRKLVGVLLNFFHQRHPGLLFHPNIMTLGVGL